MCLRNLLFLLLLVLASSVAGQVTCLTPKIGFSYSNMFWGGSPPGELKPGFALGTIAGYKISAKKYLESGIMFIQKGGSFSLDPFIHPEYKSHVSIYTLNYLVIPASLSLFINQRNNCFVNIGLSGGYLIRGTLREKATYKNGPSLNLKSNMDLSGLKRFDLGLQIGGGYKIKLSSASRLNLEVSYNLSITSLYGEWYSDLVKRNITYLACVGYEFDL